MVALQFLLLGVLAVVVVEAGVPAGEVAALQSLYTATGGGVSERVSDGVSEGGWKSSCEEGWVFDGVSDPCIDEWYGVTCEWQSESVSDPVGVSELRLHACGLVGKVPSEELLGLTRLRVMDVSRNSLTGPLPHVSTTLRELRLSENHFTGSIPTEWSELTALQHLNVSGNSVVGSIPSSIEQLHMLHTLSLSSNHLTSSLPHTLFRGMPNMRHIFLGSNQLTGTLSPHALSMEHLTDLDLSLNKLRGEIPGVNSSAARLAPLRHLYLSDNQFTSTIPTVFGLMSTLVILDLAGNYLGGTIPVNLFNNSQKPMKFVYLQSNHLRGRIPDSIGESLQLQQVFLFKNSLTGSLPTNMVKLNRLQTLLVQDNELNGWPGPAVKSIGYPHSPPQMMSALQIVDLSNNLFTGPVPTQLFELPNIRYVSITEGCFEGSLPQAVCSAPTMTHLILEGLTSGRGCATPIWDPLGLFAQGFIYGRGLDGGIPTCLFQHANLTTLHLSGNGLDGSISAPSEPKALKDLSIAYNQLSGTIPVNLLQSSYSSFDLSNNKISGTCDDMKQWTQSDTGTNSLLSLSFNRLSGNIPTVFRGLDHIDILDGNIFDCPNRNTNLPKQDPNYSTYICASDDYDEMLIIWVSFLGCLLFVFAVAFVVYVVSTKTSTISPFEGFKKSIDIWIGNIKLWNHHANSVCTVKTPEIHDFLVFLKLLRAFTFKLAVFILILFSSVYISMKMIGESGTHSYQYRWTPSAAYLSGTLAATLLVVAVLLVICFTFYSIKKFRTDIEATSSSRTISLHRVSSTAAVNGYFIQNGVDGNLNKAYIITISGFLINAVVVLVVNGIYVYLVMWRDLSTSSVLGIQIGKSIFDILWNNVALRLFMKNIKKSLHIKRLVRLVLAMLLFNTIVAPILSSLVTDSNCFVGMFVENHAISTTTTLGYCNKLVKVNITNTDDTVAQCEVYGTLTLETSYVPKFQYNYQCSSSFLSNFIPIFVFTLGSGTFIVPVLQVIMSYVLTHKVSPDMLPVIPPRAFFPGVTLHRIPNHHAFSTDMVVARLLLNITMMLTFGLACPNLAFIIGVHVYVMTWFNHLLLGRYLATSKGRDSVSDVKKESEAVQNPMTRSPMMQSVENNVTLNDVKVDASNIPMTEILENDCRGITLAPEVAMRTIIDTSSIVMAILLIDVSGDANGLVAALLTASLPVLCIPVLLRIFHRRYLAMYSENTQVTDDMSIVSSTLSNSSYFSGGESIMNHERDRKLSKAQAEAQARFDI